jgi:predicted nucleic acid-binding protein
MSGISLCGLIGDTSFWIAVFDPRVEDHQRAAELLETVRSHVILMPWPILYEVLRTRTVKMPSMVRAFDRIVRLPKVFRLDDTPYRVESLESTLDLAQTSRRSISLVDMVVRAVLADPQYRISCLLTFNQPDFHDVCRRRGIPMWPDRDEQ